MAAHGGPNGKGIGDTPRYGWWQGLVILFLVLLVVGVFVCN